MSAFSTVRLIGLSACLALALTGFAQAQDQVLRGPLPAWVQPATDTATASSTGQEGLRVRLFDTQFRAEADRQSYYLRTRSQALSPQGLAFLGNVGLAWNPSSQSVTIHHVNIERDGEIVDVLATQSFETLRREQNLEQAMLDGVLTASIQPAGLRVGDVLDVAYTIVSRDPVTAGHAEQAIDLNLPAVVDQVRYRASWRAASRVRIKAANDWTPLNVRRQGDLAFVEVRRDGAQPVIVPLDVPSRLHGVNRIELTDYRDWSDIAVALKPLYDRARRLDEGSQIKAEIDRIRALSDDPSVQAAAALRLVQDEVRYVALLMGEGALTPASADETWSRRFGDCKAKTALLLALLDGLGIPAEPAAVSLLAGDGLNERLPMIGAFDHVLVRTMIGGQVHWLDGTRTGDRRLQDVQVPPFSWALPLTGGTARLEALVVAPRAMPETELALDMDASAGLYAPAAIKGVMTLRGEAASVMAGQLGVIPESQKDLGLRAIWSSQIADLAIQDIGSSFDLETSSLVLTMTGTAALEWHENGLVPPGSTFVMPSAESRPEGPFASAPYAVIHPTFTRQVATLRLPGSGQGFRIAGGEIDRTELGHHARRAVRLDGDLVTIDTALRSLTTEVSAEDAKAARDAAALRPYDPPRVFAPSTYRTTDADRSALNADTPTTAVGWVDRAFALSRSGDNAAALAATDKAVELAPESSNAWANRGIYRFWTGDLEGAAADLEKAVDLDPSERIAMNGNALLAMVDNRHEDAVIELSRALRQVPGDDWTLEMRANSYIALEQYDRALRDTDARIANRPDDTDLKLWRIAILNMADRLDEADAEMDRVARQYPTGRNVLLNQAALKLDRGDAQAAVDILNRVVDAAPEDPTSALILRAKALIAVGRLDDAGRDFQTIRNRQPPSAETLNRLCWTAAEAGVLLDQALADCNAALELAPDAPHIIDSRGRVLLQQGDAAGAVAAYDEALSRQPRLAASLYGRGLARIALGQVADGEADKGAALELAPEIGDSFTSYQPVAAPPS